MEVTELLLTHALSEGRITGELRSQVTVLVSFCSATLVLRHDYV